MQLWNRTCGSSSVRAPGKIKKQWLRKRIFVCFRLCLLLKNVSEDEFLKIAIVGSGKLGLSLTEVLLNGGYDITLIDTNEDAISRAQDRFDVMTVRADAKKASVLKEIGIQKYDLMISATDKSEKNIFICSMAKKLGCPCVIARVRDPEHVDQLDLIRENFGVDYIVNPDLACAREIFSYLTENTMMSSGHFIIGNTAIVKFPIGNVPQLIGKCVKDTGEILTGMLLVAVSRNGKILAPNGSTQLLEKDELYIICRRSDMASVIGKFTGSGKTGSIRRVMIAGGGKSAYYLARFLEAAKVNVKIIEQNRSRCEYLSSQLDRALVINGNAADQNLLNNECMKDMDAFIALTDSDETNILLSILAQQTDVKNVVMKISHDNFHMVADTLTDTMTVNPIDMTASEILRFINKGDSVLFTKMIQGQAEFLEVLAEEGMPVTEKPLAETEIPEGVLIASLTRDNEVIIPSGETRIRPGDKVIVFTLLTSLGQAEALLTKGKAHVL